MIKVPFISNTKDDLHCLQAAYMMIAKYFLPSFDISWEDWSKLTGFEEAKGTWASSGIFWFANNNFDIKHISLFDYSAFIQNGGQYLLEENGIEVGTWQIKHSNLPKEIALSKKLLKMNLVDKREPTITDITNFLDKGYLIHCLVNAKKLNHIEGYSGHAVVLYTYIGDTIYLHDPGLPPIPNRKVSFADFELAWADPNKTSKELTAIKIKS